MMEPVESLHLQANPPALEAALRRRDNCRAFTEQRERLAILRGAIGAPIRRRELVKSLGPGCRATAEPVLKQKCRTQDQRPFVTHPKAVLGVEEDRGVGAARCRARVGKRSNGDEAVIPLPLRRPYSPREASCCEPCGRMCPGNALRDGYVDGTARAGGAVVDGRMGAT